MLYTVIKVYIVFDDFQNKKMMNHLLFFYFVNVLLVPGAWTSSMCLWTCSTVASP